MVVYFIWVMEIETLKHYAKQLKQSDIMMVALKKLLRPNNHYQKQISDQCAFDIRCSTERAIEKINAGGQGIWVCDKLIK